MVLSGGGLLRGPPQTINFVKIIMETSDKNLLMHKLNYLKLTLKISKMRYHGKEVPMELLAQAQRVGSLADIPDNELDSLLFNLNIE